MQQPAGLTERDGVPIVELFGDFDLANVAQLETCLLTAHRQQSACIIVSLLHADYFDSSTIHTLVAFGERLVATGRRLLVVGPSSDSGRRILSIFGLAKRAPIFETMPDAIASALTFRRPNDPRG